ncbi:MAG: DUF3987 domain-containing protein [Bacteroidota bacterium]|nr:DUF3987 domain-containing protein [Bacteroidota bacterium]
MKTSSKIIEQIQITFPFGFFPKTITDYANEVSLSLNCPIEYVYAGILIAASIAIGNNVRGQVKKGWKEAPMLWIVIIGGAGSKKTPAIAKTIFPFNKLQVEFGKSNAEQFESKVGYKFKTIMTTDSTIESLAETLSFNPLGVLLYRDEIIGWLGSMNQYKSSGNGDDMEKYLSIWSSQILNINRKSKPPILIESPFLSVIGGIQDEVLESLTNLKGNGFTDRILFVYPSPIKIKHTDAEISEEKSNSYENLIYSIYNKMFNEINLVLNYDEDTKKLWTEWHNDYCDKMNLDSIPYYIKSIMSKLEAYCVRFAVIIQILNDFDKRKEVTVIEKESLEGAIKLVNYFLANAEKTFSTVASSKVDKQIEKAIVFISKQAHGWASLRSIYTNKVGGVKNANEAMDLISEMRVRGLGTIVESHDVVPGKMTVTFRLAKQFIIADLAPKTT